VSQSDRNSDHRHDEDDERIVREAALDETLAQSFPASDPLSTDPNPEAHDTEQPPRIDEDQPGGG
jgi:hypothetical protein